MSSPGSFVPQGTMEIAALLNQLHTLNPMRTTILFGLNNILKGERVVRIAHPISGTAIVFAGSLFT